MAAALSQHDVQLMFKLIAQCDAQTDCQHFKHICLKQLAMSMNATTIFLLQYRSAHTNS